MGDEHATGKEVSIRIPMSLKQRIFKNRFHILLIIIWVCFQVFLYVNSHLITNREAEKYINGANEIIYYGRFPFHYISYGTYVVFLAILFKLGLNYSGVYLVQLALNLIASIAFFRNVKTITGNTRTAYTAVLMFILFYHLQHWNTHLFTESFMVSMLMIFWYGFLHFNLKKIPGIIGLGLLLILLLFSRPTAILFLPAMVVYWIIKNSKIWKEGIKIKWIVLAVSLLFILFYIFIQFEKQVLFSDLFISLQKGQVICGTAYYQEHFVSIEHHNAFWQNLLIFCKISGKKMLCFYGFIRPFYSTSHNIMLMVYYPVYPLAIIGLINNKIRREHQYMMVTFILLINALLLITCDSWEGRFIVPALPFIIVFAAIGFQKIVAHFIVRYHKQH